MTKPITIRAFKTLDEPITIRAFRAIDEPKACREFYEGHINVLRDFGIKTITSAKDSWFENPGVYCVVAEYKNKMVGGVKIHRVDKSYPLPLEPSIAPLDNRIHDIVKKYNKNGAGEACGLWNSREVAGLGLGFLLSKAIIILSYQLGIERVFALSSDHTIKMFRAIGFRVIKKIGDNGNFQYPNPKYISRVLVVNSKTLSYATPYNRENMFSLRKNPLQKLEEPGPKGQILINYNLGIKI